MEVHTYRIINVDLSINISVNAANTSDEDSLAA